MAALPVVLISPLLLSAGRLPATDSISATCNLEDAATFRQEPAEGTNVANRRNAGNRTSTQPAARSENELTAFVRDRWNAARRLIRENPYFSSGTPEEQAEAESLCLAQLEADYEVLIAQANPNELPDLGTFPSSPTPSSLIPSSPIPSSPTPNSPTVSPNRAPVNNPPTNSAPTNTTPANTAPAPAAPAARPMPQPENQSPENQSMVNPAQPTARPAIDPAALPTAQDPSVYMGPEFEPTPFDGKVIRTLADRPDGNYRYIAGEAEERAYSNEELRQRGGSVFILKKTGNTVTGDLLPRIGLPGICVTGTVSGDIITGAAYPYDTTDTLQDSVRQIGETYEPHGSGALNIRRTQTDGDRLYYAGALLDLAEYTPINAGSSLPPSSCQLGRTGGRDQK